MDLSYKELKKREVINIEDGSSLGNITDLTISFPSGVFTGISVYGRKTNCFFKLFLRNKVFIDRSKIQKIGSDVIIVDLKCGDTCAPSTPANIKKKDCSPCIPFCNNQSNCSGEDYVE